MAVIGVIAVFVFVIIYVSLGIRYRGWHFWAMYVGLGSKWLLAMVFTRRFVLIAVVECIGFTARLVSVCNTTSASAFVYSYLALL
jgi:hypothetical protein